MWSVPERRNAGSSAVEFVLVLPLLVVLVFGIIQFGIAYNRSQGMHAAVREGARLASIGAAASEVEDRIEDALGGTTVDPSDVTSGGVEVRRYADGEDPTDESLGSLVTGADVPCDGSEAAHAVRVDVEVVGNLSKYAIAIPFLPSWSQTYPSEAIFRCEG